MKTQKKQNLVPLPANNRLVELLAKDSIEKKNIIYASSIDQAYAKRLWPAEYRDVLTNVQSFLAVPINVSSSNEEKTPHLFGILYLTFLHKCSGLPITKPQCELVAAVADGLAWSVKQIMRQLRERQRIIVRQQKKNEKNSQRHQKNTRKNTRCNDKEKEEI